VEESKQCDFNYGTVTWNRVREKAVVTLLVKKFLACNGTRSSPDQSTQALPQYFSRDNFITSFLSMSRPSEWSLPFKFFDHIFCVCVYCRHVLLIKFFYDFCNWWGNVASERNW